MFQRPFDVPERIAGVARATLVPLLALAVLVAAGCVTVRSAPDALPAILENDEVPRPFTRIAVIEVTSDRFGNVEGVTRRDYEWAHRELQERALTLGADAVIPDGITIERDTFLLFPSSRIRARGVAVRLR